MEAKNNIVLKSLVPYLHLFPKATGIDHLIMRGASVADTVHFMPEAAMRSRWMVKEFVNQELKGLSRYDACKKLWFFVKQHIKYEKDAKTKEQVKSARRLISDGAGDCDCMTNFVNTCMIEYGVTELIINRITAYDYNDFFQHIYSLIPDTNGSYIIMDCVWNDFNTEKIYTNKQDYKMELQFLDGVGTTEGLDDTSNKYSNMDAQDLFGNNEDMGELGKLFRKKSPEQKQRSQEKRKAVMQKTRKVFNAVNKINPATALLRAGILASMKLNVMKVAEAIRWGYASRELAQSRGMDMSKYDRIKKILERTNNIFYSAGGKSDNLRKAILTGRGNRNKEVAGFDGLSETMDLSMLLGAIYSDELESDMEGFEGFGSLTGVNSLGEPATGASIAAASTAMGALAALIKSIGTLFPNKNKAPKKGFSRGKKSNEDGEDSSSSSSSDISENSENSENSDNSETNNDADNSNNSNSNDNEESQTPSSENFENADTNESDNLPAVQNNEIANQDDSEQPPNGESTEGLAGIGTSIKAYYQLHKKWIKPVAITLGIGTVVYLIYKSTKNNEDKPNTISGNKDDLLNRCIEGVNTRQKKKNKKQKFTKYPAYQKKDKGVIHLK